MTDSKPCPHCNWGRDWDNYECADCGGTGNAPERKLKPLPAFFASNFPHDFNGHTAHGIYDALKPLMGAEIAFIVARDGNTLRSHVYSAGFSRDVAAKTPDEGVKRMAEARASKMEAEAAKLRAEIRVFLRGLGYDI